MTEIPEHLLRRSAEAKARATGAPAPGDAASSAAAQPDDDDGVTIPRTLLEASQQPGGAPAVAGMAAGGPAAGGGGVATTLPPLMAGPAGNTHRLLTVVKSGSIQDVKASPGDKVHVWPHLLAAEFTAALFITAFTLVFSLFINAPLLELANHNETPNPSKAPWYFLGLQELLTMFDPMIAGVTIPGVALVLLAFAPYIDKNPSMRPEDRKFAISIQTIHLMFWAVLVIIGSFFRGQGFNFTYPWDTGLHGIFHL
ncbi:menaquinol-cytochrome c reductase cytochrome b subunit [Candidatus Poriferisodalis sp.]|uniref:menaquinol-cytochrome c reductase cytochrome b subunit n=1 Tax=Candidatus Poriferisodalis sp. TaxID=3101277 RepID=UPI003C7037A7